MRRAAPSRKRAARIPAQWVRRALGAPHVLLKSCILCLLEAGCATSSRHRCVTPTHDGRHMPPAERHATHGPCHDAPRDDRHILSLHVRSGVQVLAGLVHGAHVGPNDHGHERHYFLVRGPAFRPRWLMRRSRRTASMSSLDYCRVDGAAAEACTASLHHHVCRMPLILDATLNSDEALATATAKARGLERAAETSGHHDQRVRAAHATVIEFCFGGIVLWC